MHEEERLTLAKHALKDGACLSAEEGLWLIALISERDHAIAELDETLEVTRTLCQEHRRSGRSLREQNALLRQGLRDIRLMLTGNHAGPTSQAEQETQIDSSRHVLQSIDDILAQPEG